MREADRSRCTINELAGPLIRCGTSDDVQRKDGVFGPGGDVLEMASGYPVEGDPYTVISGALKVLGRNTH